MEAKVTFIDKIIDKTKSAIDTLRDKIRSVLTKKAKDYLKNTEEDHSLNSEVKEKDSTEKEAEPKAKKKAPSKKSTPKKPVAKKTKLPEAKKDDILKIIKKYEKGIKQTELYKELDEYNRQKISLLLAKMDEEKIIRREKIGTSYIVFGV